MNSRNLHWIFRVNNTVSNALPRHPRLQLPAAPAVLSFSKKAGISLDLVDGECDEHGLCSRHRALAQTHLQAVGDLAAGQGWRFLKNLKTPLHIRPTATARRVGHSLGADAVAHPGFRSASHPDRTVAM
jgi:hypothetical protein